MVGDNGEQNNAAIDKVSMDRGKRYYEENKEKIKARARAYYAAHKEECADKQKEKRARQRKKVKVTDFDKVTLYELSLSKVRYDADEVKRTIRALVQNTFHCGARVFIELNTVQLYVKDFNDKDKVISLLEDFSENYGKKVT